MVSTPRGPRDRERPEQRRAETVSEASRIALREGHERIRLRAVAEPGVHERSEGNGDPSGTP